MSEIKDQKPKVTVVKQAAKEPTRMYLGPSLPGGRLLQSTVFRGGIPAYLQPLLTEQPGVDDLIVPLDEIAGVQARITQTGTAEYVAYQKLLGKGI
ncbi:hypothetical protein [Paenibacillus monticola]|uniref:Uncharacterized protein n=1 Tax=Paenibacillus monticola TaxID=2666075 RepID=A0A7X2H1R6_9BACL|nr:hypothetical protein [Paenibacillus monticola]MRN51989.1 hypothetical protein [Paenibacillus monticola]